MDNADKLIAFYKGDGPDHRGRLIGDIWQMSHFWLEHTHDYVQWLFPIQEFMDDRQQLPGIVSSAGIAREVPALLL